MEGLAQMKADGKLGADIIRVESEQSAMSACIGSEATGVRSYTATASAGLALMHEMLFVASGMRLPIVMTVVNRSYSAPLSIWNDQQDSFAQRDSGWIQLYVENAQEAYDSHLQAYKIAEKLRTPVMVCLDGFVISHTYENVELMDREKLGKFIPEYNPEVTMNPTKPVTMGPVGPPEYYMNFKRQQQDALEKAPEVIRTVNNEFSSLTGRKYGNGLIERINMQGKDYALITIGSLTGTAREMAESDNIGIIRIKTLRPFPAEELRTACEDLKGIGVLDKDISLGANGALYDEVRSALYSLENRPKVAGFIISLGGRDVRIEDLKKIAHKVKEGAEGQEWYGV